MLGVDSRLRGMVLHLISREDTRSTMEAVDYLLRDWPYYRRI